MLIGHIGVAFRAIYQSEAAQLLINISALTWRIIPGFFFSTIGNLYEELDKLAKSLKYHSNYKIKIGV